MTSLIIDTKNLVNVSDLRKNLSTLIQDMQKHTTHYYVITENGKVVSIMIHPDFLGKNTGDQTSSINLEKLRESEWEKNTTNIQKGFSKLKKLDKKNLPKLFR